MTIAKGSIKGLVFCGGRGVRLRPLTYYFQKVMIPVGSKQKPLLEYVIKLLKYHEIHEIVLMVNYKADQIVNYFDDGSRYGIKITYVRDKPRLSGTCFALLNAFNSGFINEKDTLLIYYGDILSNIDLSDLLIKHTKSKATVSVALSKSFPIPVGVAEVGRDLRILNFVEKPVLEKPVSIGILALDGKVLKYAEELGKGRTKLDLMADLMPYLIKLGEPVYAYLTEDFWYDVGTTEKYEKLNNNFIDKKLCYLMD